MPPVPSRNRPCQAVAFQLPECEQRTRTIISSTHMNTAAACLHACCTQQVAACHAFTCLERNRAAHSHDVPHRPPHASALVMSSSRPTILTRYVRAVLCRTARQLRNSVHLSPVRVHVFNLRLPQSVPQVSHHGQSGACRAVCA